jgi:Bacterial archaeo-eukaryotic release factor family 3
MKELTTHDLKRLVEKQDGAHISIYLRTHEPGEDVHKDIIKLKNMLREAEQQLATENRRSPDVLRMFEPAEHLLVDTRFWQPYKHGIGLFIARDFFEYYHVPWTREDLLIVAQTFHVKPLLPLLLRGGFYLLALSQKNVRLFEGSRSELNEIDPPQGVPRNIIEALRDEDFQSRLQHHSTRAGGTAVLAGSYHGQGAEVFHPDERLFHFYRKIDHGLRPLLNSSQKPLVLLGLDENVPIYERANTYPNLLREAVSGSADEIYVSEIHEKAWGVVEPYYLQEQEQVADRYHESVGTGKTSEKVEEIVSAAEIGRVDQLFVAIGEQCWGKRDGDHATVHAEQQPGDIDLLDYASIHTFLNSGTVHAVDRAKVPGRGIAAALMRY